MRHLHHIAIVVAALASGACHHRPIGHFGDGAFYHSHGHYRIRYGDGPDLLSERWELTNYTTDAAGRPDREIRRDLTLDSSRVAGRGRSRPFRVPAADLVYRQRDGSAEIWARTLVLPAAWDGDHASTASVLHGWARVLADGHDEAGPPNANLQGAILANFGEAVIDGLPAHWVELDVVRDDHLERVTLVGVRPGGHRWRWGRRRSVPMLLVFGFSSTPGAHDEVRRDFERFVARVDIRPRG